jgi:hypothetical protein
MKEVCDIVAERIALGEPLGDAAEHAASCPRCRRLSALPTELGATRNESDPGIGFAARMTAGAQRRFTVRRRRRVAVTLAATVAATALGIVFLTRQPVEPVAQPPVSPIATDTHQHDTNHDDAKVDPDVQYLVHLARTDRASHSSAHWRRIEKPLAPYKHLVKGMTP